MLKLRSWHRYDGRIIENRRVLFIHLPCLIKFFVAHPHPSPRSSSMCRPGCGYHAWSHTIATQFQFVEVAMKWKGGKGTAHRERSVSYRIKEDQDQPAILRPASDDEHDGQRDRQDQLGGDDGVHHHCQWNVATGIIASFTSFLPFYHFVFLSFYHFCCCLCNCIA
jgi:hypothetical protein